MPTHLTCVYSTNCKLTNSTYLQLSSAPLPLNCTTLTALQIIFHSPQSFMSFKSGFSTSSAHFCLVNSDISPALQLKLKIVSFITSRTSAQMCFMQQHKHWEQTKVMNSCEEPLEHQSKLVMKRTTSTSSGGGYALNGLQNNTKQKPTHPLQKLISKK